MNINVARKVKNIHLKQSDYLLPLYEVIINALHAIEDKKGLGVSREIRITIKRNKQNDLFLDLRDEEIILPELPILSYEISDSGIGFGEKQIEAFNNAYTEYKKDIGGKGVGRFTVLAGFKSMSVESTYLQNGKYYLRKFSFDTESDYLPEGEPILTESKESGSIVRLNNYRGEVFSKPITLSSGQIAEKIVEHCLIYFITGKVPTILIREENENFISLQDVYKSLVSIDENEKDFMVRANNFRLIFIKRYGSSLSHRLHWCAHQREVKQTTLKSIVPNLAVQLVDSKGEYYISVYLTGEYLDNVVNDQRTGFEMPKAKEIGTAQKYSSLSEDEIVEECAKLIEGRFKEELEYIEENKVHKISSYVHSEQGIHLKHLLSRPDLLKKIPSDISGPTLSRKLREINLDLEDEQNIAVAKILKTNSDKSENYHELVNKIMANEANMTQSNLTRYMVHRKVIMKLMDDLLKSNDRGDFAQEKELHSIIYPMITDSESVNFENHNLWLLDERLAFYTYIASDLPLKRNKYIESDSRKEPDIVLFDQPMALSQGNSRESIVIYEFKRPGREFSSNERYIDNQVKEYVDLIMQSKKRDKNGELLKVEAFTPKFGYIICDLPLDLERFLISYGGYRNNPMGGLYNFYESINFYIEIVEYQTVLRNARKRHKMFFKKLGLDID